jgi:opine dehydrogenase
MRKLTILGGGNTALAVAANLTLRGFAITLCEHPSFAWTVEPITKTRAVRLEGVAKRGVAKLDRVTVDFAEALENDLLLLIVPAYAHRPFAEACAPHLRAGQVVVILPGTLGTLEFARWVKSKSGRPAVTLAETDTAPYVCRKMAPDSAHIWGVVSNLGLGVFPAAETDRVASLLGDIFTMDGLGPPSVGAVSDDASITEKHPSAIVCYSSVVECGLSAMNPVVHPPGVLMNAGRVEYSRGDFYFYQEGVTPGVCNAVYALDGERRAIGKALGFDLIPVDEAFHRAGFGPKGDLWATINGSRMLTQLRAPGALNTRWLTEDVPYGLAAWHTLGEQYGVPTPLMRSLVELASATLGQDFWKSARTVKELGIEGMSKEDLQRYLHTGQSDRQSRRSGKAQ